MWKSWLPILMTLSLTKRKKNSFYHSFGSYIWSEMRVSVCHYLMYIRRIRLHGSAIHTYAVCVCVCIYVYVHISRHHRSNTKYRTKANGKEKKRNSNNNKNSNNKKHFLHTKTVFMHDISPNEWMWARQQQQQQLWWTGNQIYKHSVVGSVRASVWSTRADVFVLVFEWCCVCCFFFSVRSFKSFALLLLLLLLLLIFVVSFFLFFWNTQHTANSCRICLRGTFICRHILVS